MTRGQSINSAIATALVAVFIFAGCGTTEPSGFYIMHSVRDDAQSVRDDAQSVRDAVDGSSNPSTADLTIGVGPLDLPEYLDRPQIVVRASRNEIELAEFDRWAEPLKGQFVNILAENLGILLGTDRVVVHPFSSAAKIAYSIAIDVVAFDGTPDGEVSLTVRWVLLDKKGVPVVVRKSSFVRPAGEEDDDFETMVAAQSELLADFCREIASAIASAPSAPSN